MLKDDLKKLLKQALKKIKADALVMIETPPDKTFGDFSSNIALQISKDLKKNPRIVAEEIVKSLPKNLFITKTSLEGPGFINFWLRDEKILQAFVQLFKKIEQGNFGKLKIGKGKTALTDSSHPNVAKPMGVHNVLSTILGQTINHFLKNAGYKVIKDNYLGDWGTQFGKLIVAIKTFGDMKVIKKNPIRELLKLYVHFHDEAEKNPAREDEARKEFKKLEDGDPENLKLWEWIRDISLLEFKKTWDRLGVSFDMIHGEAYYRDKMQSVIDHGLKKKILVKGEGGALIIPMDDPNSPPCLLRKSDGATIYSTRDIARIKDWEETYKGDLGVVIVDIAQKLHHDQINEAAAKLGWGKMESVRVHFGRMSFPEGNMSTRKGHIIFVEDVLDEAEKRAYEKIQMHKSELPEDEKRELARKMGVGAIKYNILSQNRFKNYTFNWDQMLSFEGNSAPYLQYAYTRTRSIEKKAEDEKMKWGSSFPSSLEPQEKQLIKKLMDFEETLESALKEFKPNLLCNYLFELAQIFSHFYNSLRILDAEKKEERNLRYALTIATGYSLKKGLDLLGIEVPERM